MVLDPVSCPAGKHCTTVFALLNCKFSRLGDDSSPYPLNSPPGGRASREGRAIKNAAIIQHNEFSLWSTHQELFCFLVSNVGEGP